MFTVKARLTRQGNIFLHEYCEEKGLKLNKCGKLVVARVRLLCKGTAKSQILRRMKPNLRAWKSCFDVRRPTTCLSNVLQRAKRVNWSP